jgi:hypothetical protein
MEDLKSSYNAERVKPDNGDLSSSTPYPKIITLDIGGRKFKTTLDTLRSGSGLFHRQLSGRFPWSRQEDGSYFMDADPDLFAHLLRFMRRPEVFPLFYTKANGFDYDLYNRLEIEAEYFQMDELREWIKEKKYLKAIETHTQSAQVGTLNQLAPKSIPAHHSQDNYMVPRTRRIYVCPRGIFVHRGDKNRCGQACDKARGSREDEYDEEQYMEVVSVEKETKFDGAVCMVD